MKTPTRLTAPRMQRNANRHTVSASAWQTASYVRHLLQGAVIGLAVMVVTGCSGATTVDAATLRDLMTPGAPPVQLENGITVHRISMLVSNAFLIETDAGVILVDAGLPTQEGFVLRALRRIGRADDLKLIYITHAHVDHYGSANALREATGAPIAIHEADALTMAAGESPLGQIRDLEWVSETTLPLIERAIAILEPTEPDIILQDGDRLDEYGLDGYVLYTPGHTPGSSTLIVADQYAFAGDLISATGSPHAQNSYAFSWQRVSESLQRLQELGPELTFAGHGADPVTQAELDTLSVDLTDGPGN